MMIIFWISLIVICLVVEIITVGLTSIWFAGGGFLALIACAIGAPVWLQVPLFLVSSLIFLYFTRPWALKYFNPGRTKTNYEDAVGKTVRITEKVDNLAGTGIAVLNGLEWSARTEADGITIEADTIAEVVAVRGVRLIVK